jgi:glycine betaine/choline ABC-type transport system substrate-binding protein
VRVLEDDRHYFPPYQCAAVVRETALARYPELRSALKQIRITDEQMRKLNQRVEGGKRPVREVAAEFLKGG